MKRGSFDIAFLILGLLMVLGMSQNIWAEEMPVYEEEVVVTATRVSENASETPGQTEVITKEEIKDSATETVAQLLAQQGEIISTNGDDFSVATIRLDGATAEQSLILINGIPANRGCVGVVDLSYFPKAVIDRIEIVHGPLSSLYGANALGGVVNIIYDLTGEPQNELAYSVGSFNTGNLGYVIREQQWGLALGGSDTEGFRDYSEATNRYLIGQYDFYNESERYLSLNLQYLEKESQDPGRTSWLLFGTKSSESNLGINLNSKANFWQGIWEYKLYGQQLDYHYDSLDQPLFSRHQANTYGWDLAGVYSIGTHELLTGLALKREEFDSTITGNHAQEGGGIFLQDSWSFEHGTRLISGVRWDTNSDYQSAFVPRINLVQALNDQFNLKLGYGRAFRAPTINELYWYEAGPGWGMFGDPDLRPERGERYDFVLEWRQASASFSLNYFQSKLRDGISWVDPENDWIYTATNIARQRSKGLALKFQNTWFERFTGKLTYNWIDQHAWNESTSNYDQELNFFGSNQINLGLTLAFDRWRYSLDGNWISGRQQYNTAMPDYNVTNFNISFQPKEDLKVILSILNLMDEVYYIQPDYPMSGREWKLSMNRTF